VADYPPYMNAYGNVTKILNKVKDAKTPDRFSQDYLETVLGFRGGGARPFIPLAKRIGLLNADGTPSDLYSRFRNPAQSEQAMAEMIRKGYPELYRRNEYAHALDKVGLQGLVMEVTGLDRSSETLKAIANTFEALRTFANFELTAPPALQDEAPKDVGATDAGQVEGDGTNKHDSISGLRFSHNIFINLPDTKDIEVFNAIFKAMKDNLLS
jgi:hypothetical protein